MKRKFWIMLVIFVGYLLALNSCTGIKTPETVPVIVWADPLDISYGTPLSSVQLNAYTGVSGFFVYTPPTETVLAVGRHELKVQFNSTEPLTQAYTSKSVFINVNNKKTPVITWANPTDIAVGTLLSATQLNAVADVPGTFCVFSCFRHKINYRCFAGFKSRFYSNRRSKLQPNRQNS